MVKYLRYVLALIVPFLLGCGGSNTRPATDDAGITMTSYVASLPDGNAMLITLTETENGLWEGDYFDTAESGPDAFDYGNFGGTIVGNKITAVGRQIGGEDFTFVGVGNHGSGFQMTRSDMPGVSLSFVPIPEPKGPSRGTVRFRIERGRSQIMTIDLGSDPVWTNGNISLFKGMSGDRHIEVFGYHPSPLVVRILGTRPVPDLTYTFHGITFAELGKKVLKAGSLSVTWYDVTGRGDCFNSDASLLAN